MTDILQDIKEKIKVSLEDQRYFLSLVLILVAVTAFGLGRQSAREGEAIKPALAGMEEKGPETMAPESLPTTFYVGSRNGEVYHLPHCSGAKRISEANRVTFNTKSEAEAAGYRPARNCKGI